MTEIYDWVQSHWFELGSLLVQGGILVAVIWYARKTFRAMRASQEQVGALLKMSLTDLTAARPAPNEAAELLRPTVIAERAISPAIVGRSAATEAYAFAWMEPAESKSGGVVAAWHNLIHWFQAPMGRPGAVPKSRLLRWLLAPTGS